MERLRMMSRQILLQQVDVMLGASAELRFDVVEVEHDQTQVLLLWNEVLVGVLLREEPVQEQGDDVGGALQLGVLDVLEGDPVVLPGGEEEGVELNQLLLDFGDAHLDDLPYLVVQVLEHHVVLEPLLAVQVWARVVLSLPLFVGPRVPVLEGLVVALQVRVHAPLLEVLKGLCTLPQCQHDLLADCLRIWEDLELETGDVVNRLGLEGLELHGCPHLLLCGRDVERALVLLVGLSVGLRLVGGPRFLLVVLAILGLLLWLLACLLWLFSITLDLEVDRRVELLPSGLSERRRHELDHVHLVDGVLRDLLVLQVGAFGLKEGYFGLAQGFAVVRHLHSGVVLVVHELVEDLLVDLPVQFSDALLDAQLLHRYERLHGNEIVEERKSEDLQEGGA